MSLAEIDALIGLPDIVILKMLETISQTELAVLAKSYSKPYAAAELEGAAEFSVVTNEGWRDQMQADESAFQIWPNTRNFLLSKPEYRNYPNFDNGLVVVIGLIPAPPTKR